MMKELMQMGFLPSTVMVLLLVALLAVIATALWQRKLVMALASVALFFAVLGIELFLLAAFDWAMNDIAYTWGGLPQVMYDTPLYLSFAFTIFAVAVCGYRLYRRRMERAALAPAERTVGVQTSELSR